MTYLSLTQISKLSLTIGFWKCERLYLCTVSAEINPADQKFVILRDKTQVEIVTHLASMHHPLTRDFNGDSNKAHLRTRGKCWVIDSVDPIFFDPMTETNY